MWLISIFKIGKIAMFVLQAPQLLILHREQKMSSPADAARAPVTVWPRLHLRGDYQHGVTFHQTHRGVKQLTAEQRDRVGPDEPVAGHRGSDRVGPGRPDHLRRDDGVTVV